MTRSSYIAGEAGQKSAVKFHTRAPVVALTAYISPSQEPKYAVSPKRAGEL